MGARYGLRDRFVKRETGDACAPLGGGMSPRILHQDLAHQVSGNPEKVGAILPLRRILARQPHIGFVYQGRALQSVVGAFPLQVIVRQAAQFVVDHRHEDIECLTVSLSPTD